VRDVTTVTAKQISTCTLLKRELTLVLAQFYFSTSLECERVRARRISV